MYSEVKQYGFFVQYGRPQQTFMILRLRSKIAGCYPLLNSNERAELLCYDRLLLHNADFLHKSLHHIRTLPHTTYPIEEWWWYLDKIAEGSLYICLSTA